jgi:DNA recombination protein RmuC
LYDQVVLVVEAMLDAQKKLDGVRDSFDSAMKRLKDGRGNVVGRIEEIRKLGLKANRLLSQDIIDVAVGQAEQNDADTKSMD